MKNQNRITIALSLTLLFFVSAYNQVKAQSNVKFTEPKKVQADATVAEVVEEKPYLYTDQMPAFEGGKKAFEKFMAANLKYTSTSAADSPVATFIVEKDGSISNLTIVRSASPSMDLEAFRVLELTSGKWKPGKQNGRVVRVKLTQTVVSDFK